MGTRQMHGHGVFTHPNGDTYVGDWKNGYMTGVGVSTTTDADGKIVEHTGHWKDDKRHGEEGGRGVLGAMERWRRAPKGSGFEGGRSRRRSALATSTGMR